MPEKLSDDEIIKIQKLHHRGMNIPQIVEILGHSTSTIDKYIKNPSPKNTKKIEEMKIKLYRKAPKCPKCKVPMSFETMTYSDEQEKKMNCEHNWKKGKAERDEEATFGRREDKCKICRETRTFIIRYKAYDGKEIEPREEEMTFMHMPSANVYRCPKCLNLYKVEKDEELKR